MQNIDATGVLTQGYARMFLGSFLEESVAPERYKFTSLWNNIPVPIPRSQMKEKEPGVFRICSYYCCLVAKMCPNSCAPWTVAHQVHLSTEFSRQEYWSGLPFPPPGKEIPPGELPEPRIEPMSPSVSCIGRQILYHWITLEYTTGREMFTWKIDFLNIHLSKNSTFKRNLKLNGLIWIKLSSSFFFSVHAHIFFCSK